MEVACLGLSKSGGSQDANSVLTEFKTQSS